ncbi:permease YjgP/YjgQ family [Azotobacter vinelandii CA]|uniref:Lipopolysaccharide export system permease protein LptF n=2 Tax=Azotobacter vinelandii TaxID=354 RepID=C1DGQ5_AZOVD|nr:LPS export ABC transporter permease LptF [Azotobacter vinelandii]ACO80551.1 permease YjgP/YjgQ family [Azotobacter vinelandii DJ]AGK14359.1 permease YjgP/YjgQ family [Azotobacter vinelandii CA]AGK22001.1 permease YjgP/YjgQ family [Azotobacter vinelandii CA6]WKN21313.1 LPS export ABC transporter permease LptF [Azotobacter vinelandii]SFX36940.1 lipopolysaccharide export system permease protein [Azotobacter vinelandii]
MLLIERYVISEARRPLLVMLGILTSIFAAYSAERYLGEAANGTLSPEVVFDIVVYKVMIALEVLVPVALYVSVALGLGRLYHDSEITAVAAAGMSPLRLYGAVAILALPIAVGVTALSLYGRPWAYANAYQLEQESKTELDIDHLLAERFNINAENGRMILAERVDRATDSLQDVLIFDGGESRTRLYRSQEARIADPDPDDPVVEMTNGTAYSLQHDGTQDKRIEFKRLNIHLQPLETNMESRRKAASWQTLEASAGLPEQAELQWRESRGVSTFILALLAIPLSRTAPRRGRFATLLPVTAVYAVIFYAGDICKSLVGNGSLPLTPGLWLVPLAMGLVLLALIVRERAIVRVKSR